MLQQTTAAVVAPRFEEFVERWPTVAALASASEDDVMQAWSGLGYYRRARALHRGAVTVVEEFGGRLPDSEDGLRKIPGIGDYTAAAIASLAFGRRAAAIDGNVARSMSRQLALDEEISTARARRALREAILDRMPQRDTGRFSEALIELGALVCRPTSPRCADCPVAESCEGLRDGSPERWPIKKARRASIPILAPRARVVGPKGALLLIRRGDEETLMPGFWELPELGPRRGVRPNRSSPESSRDAA